MNIENKEQYKLNLIIFHNTEKSNYVELPIKQSLINFSGNNAVGKTSKIMALPIIFSAEENFKGCKKKFGHDYDNNTSYKYYFPEDNSFIITEHSNMETTGFCQIIMKGDETPNIQRAFVNKAYSEIKEWFISPEDNKPTKISRKELIKLINENDGEIANSKARMNELMFQADNKYDGLYNIASIKNDNTDLFLNCYRVLLKEKDDSLVEKIMTSLLEEDEGIKQVNDLDIIEKTYKLNDVIEKLKKAQKKEEHRKDYEKFISYLIEYKEYVNYYKRFIPEYSKLRNYIDLKITELENSTKEINKLKHEYDKHNENVVNKQAEINAQEKSLISLKEEHSKKIREINKQIEKIKEDKSEATVLFTTLIKNEKLSDVKTIQEMIERLEKSLNDLINTLNNKSGVVSETKLNNLKRKLTNAQNDLRKFKTELENAKDKSILSKEDEYNINILSKILSQSIKQTDYHNNIEDIKTLLNMVKEQDNKVELFNTYFGKIKATPEKRKVEEIEEDIRQVDKEILEIQENIKIEIAIIEESKKLLKDIQKAESHKLKIEGYLLTLNKYFNVSDDVLKEKETNLAEIESDFIFKLKNIESEIGIFKTQLTEIKKKEVNAKAALTSFEISHNKLIAEKAKKEKLLGRTQLLLIEKTTYTDDMLISESNISHGTNFDEEFIKNISEIIKKRKEYYKNIDSILHELFMSEIIKESDYQKYHEEYKYKVLEENIKKDLDSIYENNKNIIKEAQLQATDDKNSIIEGLSILTNLVKTIQNKLKSFNERMTLSENESISAIKIDYTIDSKIEEFCNKIESHRESNDGLEIHQYDDLINYLKSFSEIYDGKPIGVNEVVKNIGIKIVDKKGIIKEKGSEGQNLLVKLIFTTTVFSSILDENATLNLPLIIDEINKLDDTNKIYLINKAKDFGFFIISSTPYLEINSIDAEPVDYFDLDLSTLFTEDGKTTSISNSYERTQSWLIEEDISSLHVKEEGVA